MWGKKNIPALRAIYDKFANIPNPARREKLIKQAMKKQNLQFHRPQSHLIELARKTLSAQEKIAEAQLKKELQPSVAGPAALGYIGAGTTAAAIHNKTKAGKLTKKYNPDGTKKESAMERFKRRIEESRELEGDEWKRPPKKPELNTEDAFKHTGQFDPKERKARAALEHKRKVGRAYKTQSRRILGASGIGLLAGLGYGLHRRKKYHEE